MNEKTENNTNGYEKPVVVEYGELRDLTAGTVYFGTEDGRVKGSPTNPIPHFSSAG